MRDILNQPDSDFEDENYTSGKDPLSRQDIETVNAKQLADQNKKSSSGLNYKLTGWEKEPSLTALKQDLLECKTFRDDQVTQVDKWKKLKDGGDAIPKRRGRSSVQPKLIRRQAEWRYSALSEPFLSSENIFKVEPRTFEDAAAASQNALLINWQFRTKIDLVRTINQAVRTFVDEGTLVLQPGWCREVEDEEVMAPVYQYQQVYEGSPEEQQLSEALQLKQTNPRGFLDLDLAVQESVSYSQEKGVAAWAIKVSEEPVVQEKIIKNHPTLEIVDYRNIYIDPSCNGDPTKARFMIKSFETSKAELLKDGRYKNLDTVNYSGGSLLADSDHGTETPKDFTFSDELRRRVVAYEYWGLYDIDGTGILKPIVATWINNQFIRMENNPYPDQNHPFLFAAYSPKQRSVFGEPDAEILEDNQKISGALIRGMIDLLGRSANAQQGFQKGMLDVINRRRFEQGEDYEFNPTANPNAGLISHKYTELPASALTLLDAQNREAEGLTGVKAFSGGLTGEGFGEVAAGIRGTLDAASKREMDILRRLAEIFKQAAVKIIAMNGLLLSEEEVVRVTNEQFVVVRRDELEGNFDLIVDISTPEIDERRANDLAFMLQTVGPTLAPQFTQMILTEIAQLRKMPALAKKIETYTPEPDPVEEAMKQLEVAKIEEQISKLKSETARNYAQAEKFQSDADATDLETEMKGTGVTHAQDMERQTEQARGNQDLALTKALVTPTREGETPPDIEAGMGLNRLTSEMARAGNQPAPAVPIIGASPLDVQ